MRYGIGCGGGPAALTVVIRQTKPSVANRTDSPLLGIFGVLPLCAVILSRMARTLVPTARGYARPTIRNGQFLSFFLVLQLESDRKKLLIIESFFRILTISKIDSYGSCVIATKIII